MKKCTFSVHGTSLQHDLWTGLMTIRNRNGMKYLTVWKKMDSRRLQLISFWCEIAGLRMTHGPGFCQVVRSKRLGHTWNRSGSFLSSQFHTLKDLGMDGEKAFGNLIPSDPVQILTTPAEMNRSYKQWNGTASFGTADLQKHERLGENDLPHYCLLFPPPTQGWTEHRENPKPIPKPPASSSVGLERLLAGDELGPPFKQFVSLEREVILNYS